MLDVLRWYVVLQLIGFAALPLTARAFRALPDRGYAFARPVGLLAVAVLLWFGSIFGFWTNSGATVALITVALGLVGWLAMPRFATSVRALWRGRRSHVLVVEGVFLLAFVIWAICRAHFSAIEATEKPMELGFLNGIIRSQRFPPVDPWLSGSSISYYYLGYVIVAALTEASGVAAAVAFNLAIATLFALTITGAFALGTSLVDGLRCTRASFAGRRDDDSKEMREWPSWLGGGIAAWFVALLGNWEGFLELLHAHGLGSESFYTSLALYGLGKPVYLSTTWYPNETQDFYWWFHASRVITDYPFGTTLPKGFTNYNTINEFPFFSFLLGDLHPHVLALPFAFVCLAYALSFLRSSDSARLDRLSGSVFDFGFVAFLFGAMFLLNAWDILTYLFVLVCVFAVRRFIALPRFDRRWLRDTALFGGLSLIASVALYWPFYVTFRSQASGLLGLVELHSHLSYFLIFWAPFLFLGASLVVADLVFGVSPFPRPVIRAAGPSWTRGPAIWIAVAVIAVVAAAFDAPAVALVLPVGLAALVLVLRYLVGGRPAVPHLVPSAAGDQRVGAGEAPNDRPRRDAATVAGGATPASLATEHVYVLVLLFVAMLLLFGTEVVFIKDSFNNRMNTVFKLYFQAWELLAIVGAYCVFYIGSIAFTKPRAPAVPSDRRQSARPPEPAKPRRGWARPASVVWLVAAALLVAGAFVYVPAATAARSNGFTSEATLDGLQYYARFQPDDANAIAWLNHNVTGTPTIVEASGGSYSQFAEVAWMTGLPTLLGWDFHELQWRGASISSVEEERKRDIDTIYRSNDAKATQDLLKKYGVTYVYVGPMEKQVYVQNQGGLGKFGQFMDVVYRNPGVTIYHVRGTP